MDCRVISSASAEFAHCRAVRMEVFVGEQQVPPEEEMDELDDAAVHVLALLDGQPVGTGRLILEDGGTARIGRMAVLQPFRGRGLGGAILRRLMDLARERDVRVVRLAGQLHAIPFYEHFGFVAYGDVFLDAGIEHRMMEQAIA